MRIDVAVNLADTLGEAPLWCDRQKLLYWSDLRRNLVHALDPSSGEVATWSFPEMTCSFALAADNVLAIALQSRLVRFATDTGTMETIAAPEASRPDMRFNDGKCDPGGRFVVGSMDDVTREPVGAIWSIGPHGRHRRLFDGLRIPNGLAWSPGGTRMYVSDTMTGTIWTCAYDAASGEAGPREIFAEVEEGGPDGGTVDAEGYYWCAIYGGWRIERYAPSGHLDRTMKLPVQNPSSCAFGGDTLEQLYITTARQRLSEAELAAQPFAGAVLLVEPGVRGLPSVRFGSS